MMEGQVTKKKSIYLITFQIYGRTKRRNRQINNYSWKIQTFCCHKLIEGLTFNNVRMNILFWEDRVFIKMSYVLSNKMILKTTWGNTQYVYWAE
jgi:hypothetical protein